MRQDVYEHLPLDQAVERFDEITASANSVSLFTDWRGPTIDQVWLKRRVRDGDAFQPAPDFFGATARDRAPIHPIRRMSPEACTEQLGVAGPWHERLPHFRMDHTPSSGAELQTEYLIARHGAGEAIAALDRIRDRFSALVQVGELRTVAADDLWMSTAYGRDTVGIHFTWEPDWEAVRAVLPVIDDVLAPFDPRPHWGKVFTLGHEESGPRTTAFPTSSLSSKRTTRPASSGRLRRPLHLRVGEGDRLQRYAAEGLRAVGLIRWTSCSPPRRWPGCWASPRVASGA